MHTMLRKRNPIMDIIRRRGLHPPEETPPVGQGMVDMRHSDGLIWQSGRRSTNCTRLTIPGPALGITMTAPQYPVGVSHQVWGKCGSMGGQKARTGTMRMMVIVILRNVLKKRRGVHMICGTCGTCWRTLSGCQCAFSWCQTMFHTCARRWAVC